MVSIQEQESDPPPLDLHYATYNWTFSLYLIVVTKNLTNLDESPLSTLPANAASSPAGVVVGRAEPHIPTAAGLGIKLEAGRRIEHRPALCTRLSPGRLRLDRLELLGQIGLNGRVLRPVGDVLHLIRVVGQIV